MSKKLTLEPSDYPKKLKPLFEAVLDRSDAVLAVTRELSLKKAFRMHKFPHHVLSQLKVVGGNPNPVLIHDLLDEELSPRDKTLLSFFQNIREELSLLLDLDEFSDEVFTSRQTVRLQDNRTIFEKIRGVPEPESEVITSVKTEVKEMVRDVILRSFLLSQEKRVDICHEYETRMLKKREDIPRDLALLIDLRKQMLV
jgi:hypothetical protein